MSGARANGTGGRPLSPHLQVWRWHITLAASILHRGTGVALYVGAVIAAGWAASLAAGPEAFEAYRALLGSPLGKLVLIGLTFSAFYHLANGIRHLVWDAGLGFTPRTASASAAGVLAFGAVATIAVWAVAFLMGAA
jgi:succinate dehydrogenase / fumarate reductase cytochrome b subunit